MASDFSSEAPKTRTAAKAARKASLIREAARLFADQGYSGVSLEDIGSAVGFSGPAIYRHFPSKQALLAAVLLDASEGLYRGASQLLQELDTAEETLKGLVAFHVDFALQNPEVIRVQDSEITHLNEVDRSLVRTLQRSYIEVWIKTLSGLIDAPYSELRLRTQATIGLLNSTPHSADAKSRNNPSTANVLETMAHAALTA